MGVYKNLQSKDCGFYNSVKKRCEITNEYQLICDYKHCTLYKTVAKIRADKKKYGGLQ